MKERFDEHTRAGALCPFCESRSVVTVSEATTFPYGNELERVEIPVTLDVHTCQACGEEFLDDSAEMAKQDAICRHLGRLTPAEIKGIRERAGLTRREFAEHTGFGEATLARWERGELLQSLSSDRYLRLLRESRSVTILPSLQGLSLANRFSALKHEKLPILAERAKRFELAPRCT